MQDCRGASRFSNWQFKTGRRRKLVRPRDFLDKLATVRSLFNAFKRRQPDAVLDGFLEKWWRSFVFVLSAGAINIGFAAQHDPTVSQGRDIIRELGPAKVFDLTLKTSSEQLKAAGWTPPAEILLSWSDRAD
jgi:hypothetical protein